METMTKREMVSEIAVAAGYNQKTTEKIVDRGAKKDKTYIERCYSDFLKNREVARFYAAILSR